MKPDPRTPLNTQDSLMSMRYKQLHLRGTTLSYKLSLCDIAKSANITLSQTFVGFVLLMHMQY